MRFHFMKKGGFEEGARPDKVLLNGNPADRESRGVVVFMKYPTLVQKPAFTINKTGIGLIEAAFIYAYSRGIKTVIAVSRLGEAYKYIT